MRKHPKKTCLFLLLTTMGLLWLFAGRKAVAETGADRDLTCSLSTEVPVGQVTDQLISNDQSTAVKIMRALDELNSFSNQVISGAKDVLILEESCSPSRCLSNCQKSHRRKSATPTTGCTPGHTCDYQNRIVGGGDLINEVDSSQAIDCTKLGQMDPYFEIDPEHFYGAFDWESNGVDPCSPGFSPDCGSYTCVKQPDNPKSGLTGNWRMCTNPFVWEDADPAASYNWYKVTEGGSCLVRCGIPPGDSGSCFVDWTEEYCRANACSGEACDFATLDQKANNVYGALTGAKAAYQKIDEVINLKIANLPFIGNICQVPGLGILCQFCWFSQIPIPGFTNILSGCKTEIETILGLHEKSLTNIRGCQTNPQNFFEDQTGKILLRCENLMPDILQRCYPNNFYCCQ